MQGSEQGPLGWVQNRRNMLPARDDAMGCETDALDNSTYNIQSPDQNANLLYVARSIARYCKMAANGPQTPFDFPERGMLRVIAEKK